MRTTDLRRTLLDPSRNFCLHQLAAAVGERVPFIIFLKNFEVLLYEIMSWLIFYPRTLWRCGRHPLQMVDRGECDLKLSIPEQFTDIVSPPLFLLLTVIVASGSGSRGRRHKSADR